MIATRNEIEIRRTIVFPPQIVGPDASEPRKGDGRALKNTMRHWKKLQQLRTVTHGKADAKFKAE